MDLSETELQAALREHFGLEAFRGHQRGAIEAVLAGRDVLATMPTGAGKSLIYQFPAVVLEGMTLVVSPLIALMKDQVDGLRQRGIRATFVNSSIDGKTRTKRLASAMGGELDLLFVTPERFRSPEFRGAIPKLNVTRLAVDEAHCISQWGHDFRPDYSKLGEYRALLGSPPTVALTATATTQVASDIVGRLGLEDPFLVRTGIERPNLFLGARSVFEADEKVPLLAERVRQLEGPGIVYSALIRDLERLHTELRRMGIPSLVYHGKLSPEERRRMQDRFMASDRDVVLATNAFGMGVDKEDIRFVLHAQIPRTLEAWTQEVGRAGRDGKPSFCELIYFEEDVAVQQGFVQWANPSREYLFSVYETLRGWGERVQTKDLDDLRSELLVKNRSDNRVSICLKWLEVLGVTEGSFESHSLRVVKELEPNDLPAFVGSEQKLRGDLAGLLSLVRFASRIEGCRRVAIAQHFDLPTPEVPCGACDVCSDAESWVAEHHRPRPLQDESALQRPGNPEPQGAPGAWGAGVEEDPVPERAGARQRGTSGPSAHRRDGAVDASPPERPAFERGDWIRIGRRGLAQVLRVDGEGERVRLQVEDARDLKRRTVDPRRVRVERLESPEA